MAFLNIWYRFLLRLSWALFAKESDSCWRLLIILLLKSLISRDSGSTILVEVCSWSIWAIFVWELADSI